jgi:hypothetical protein
MRLYKIFHMFDFIYYNNIIFHSSNHSLPGVPTVRGLDMSSPRGEGGSTPGGLFVRRGRSGAKNTMIMLA